MTEQESNHQFFILLVTVLQLIVVGVLFYHFYEGMALIDAYYFTVITLTTVGYGDITPTTTIGKIFTTFYVFFGIGILVALINLSAKRRFMRKKSPKKKK